MSDDSLVDAILSEAKLTGIIPLAHIQQIKAYIDKLKTAVVVNDAKRRIIKLEE